MSDTVCVMLELLPSQFSPGHQRRDAQSWKPIKPQQRRQQRWTCCSQDITLRPNSTFTTHRHLCYITSWEFSTHTPYFFSQEVHWPSWRWGAGHFPFGRPGFFRWPWSTPASSTSSFSTGKRNRAPFFKFYYFFKATNQSLTPKPALLKRQRTCWVENGYLISAALQTHRYWAAEQVVSCSASTFVSKVPAWTLLQILPLFVFVNMASWFSKLFLKENGTHLHVFIP